jgi:hypothetical protein
MCVVAGRFDAAQSMAAHKALAKLTKRWYFVLLEIDFNDYGATIPFPGAPLWR